MNQHSFNIHYSICKSEECLFFPYRSYIFLDSFFCESQHKHHLLFFFFQISNRDYTYQKAPLEKRLNKPSQFSTRFSTAYVCIFIKIVCKLKTPPKTFARLRAPIPILLSLRQTTIYGHMSPSGGKWWNYPKTVYLDL